MLTSDSENNFKFSSAREIPSAASTTPLQPAASIVVAVSTEPPKERVPPDACAAHQLRCVSGKCITVDQLCDKVSKVNSSQRRIWNFHLSHIYITLTLTA